MKLKRHSQEKGSRFVVGTLATAAASLASGATVQITFVGNVVTSSSGLGLTNFVADLTGDGVDDITGMDRERSASVIIPTFSGFYSAIAVDAAGFLARAGTQVATGSGAGASARGFSPIVFQDPRINGNRLTSGILELAADARSGNLSVQVHRLIFDDESVDAPYGVTIDDAAYPTWSPVSAVPEASSSLALLALGAGGLLTRRRTKRAA